MIRSRLRILMAERGIKYVKDLAKPTGLSTKALSRLGDNQTTRFDAPVLNALCAYFGVGVGEILEYVPDEPGSIEQPKPGV